MELRLGYKQTQVGVIPEEWEVDMIGDAFDISGGISASRDQLSANGYCYLHYGDIHKSAQSFINVRLEYLDLPKLDVSLSQVPSRSLLSDGDVVFVDASEDDLGTSKHLVVINPEAIPYISGLHTIVAKSKTPSFENTYKRYCFQTHDLRRQFYYYAAGTKVSGISKTNVKKIFILRPPFPEQRAIAAALSDVDALIDTLDRLIAKKRDLKHAAVQQLLTGQTRLPGFSEEWDVKRLEEVAHIDPENLSSNIPPRYTFNYISLEDVDLGVLCNYSEQMFCTAPSRARRKLQKGDILVSTVRPNLKSHLLFNVEAPDWVCSTGFSVVRCQQGSAHPGYVFFHLFGHGISRQIETLLTGSNYPAINSGDVRSLQIPLPRYDEQTAIATLLSDMDAEIAALEARREKTRALKQGMMQELLTGRIRLI